MIPTKSYNVDPHMLPIRACSTIHSAMLASLVRQASQLHQSCCHTFMRAHSKTHAFLCKIQWRNV